MSLRKQLSPAPPSATASIKPLRYNYPVYVAIAVSLALMGDAFLYGVLPSQASHLGIPLVFVGVLLSANRFIRLITNTWAASVYRRLGHGTPFVVAMLVASCTTLAYSVPLGAWWFLAARITWGICWSFLQLGMYFSILHHTESEQRGQWMGKTKAISRLGTIAAVSIGGYLTDLVGFRTVTAALGMFALAGTWIAYRTTLRAGMQGEEQVSSTAVRIAPASASMEAQPPPVTGNSAPVTGTGQQTPPQPAVAGTVRPPAIMYVMGFVFGFVMHGVVVGTMALLVTQRYGASVGLLGWTIGAATASGALLAVRWTMDILLSPATGRLGDRIGADRIVPLSAAILSLTLVGISFVYTPHWLLLIACVAFLAGLAVSVCLDAVAGDAAVNYNNVSQVMSRYVTAQDLGSAVGPLAGYLIGLGLGLDGFYRISALGLLVVAVLFARQMKTRRHAVAG